MVDVKRHPALMAHAIKIGEDGGAFQFGNLRVVASWGGGWDHVSVSLNDRCPTWDEMELIRKWFFYPTEVCIQYGISGPDKKNVHPYCLHWWRPHDHDVLLPPREFV